MVEQPILTIKSKQKRTNDSRAPRITKSANDTVDRADLLYFNHCSAFARSICSVQTLRNNAIKIAAGFFKPLAGSPMIGGGRRKAQIFGRSEIKTCESFEKSPAFPQDSLQIHLPLLREQIENDV